LELIPRTLRDAMVFEIKAPPARLNTALDAFSEILMPKSYAQAAIDREVGIVRQEGFFRQWTSLLGEAAWNKLDASSGGDPFGSVEVIRTATTDGLNKLQTQMFTSSNAALVIAGDVDLDITTAAAKKVLDFVPTSRETTARVRKPSGGGFVQADTKGFALGIPVATYRDPSTAARLAVGLYVASQLEQSFVTYTPSAQAGVIIIGAKKTSDLNDALRNLDSAAIFYAGKDLAKRWVKAQLSGPSNIAFWRGLLLVQARDLRPETLSENVDLLTQAQIQSAIDLIKSEQVVRVVGEE
jgi:predicted Zn-dependent peptidase